MVIQNDTVGPLSVCVPLRYRTYVFDSETGFYCLQSRYYDPEIGRFINADALVSTGQGLLGNNMFAYCGNNPITGANRDGKPIPCAVVGGRIISAPTGKILVCAVGAINDRPYGFFMRFINFTADFLIQKYNAQV